MASIPTPKTFNFHSDNVKNAWMQWSREFKLYLDLAMTKANDDTKIKMLQYLLGSKGREVYDTLQFKAEDGSEIAAANVKIADVLRAFDAYFNPKVSETIR